MVEVGSPRFFPLNIVLNVLNDILGYKLANFHGLSTSTRVKGDNDLLKV